MYGAVHVTFRRKVDNGPRTAASQEIAHQLSVTDISVYERVPWIGRNRYQIAKIPSVSELVKIYDRTAFGREPLQNEIGADKTGSSSH
jgi:hypothetical protein